MCRTPWQPWSSSTRIVARPCPIRSWGILSTSRLSTLSSLHDLARGGAQLEAPGVPRARASVGRQPPQVDKSRNATGHHGARLGREGFEARDDSRDYASTGDRLDGL